MEKTARLTAAITWHVFVLTQLFTYPRQSIGNMLLKQLSYLLVDRWLLIEICQYMKRSFPYIPNALAYVDLAFLFLDVCTFHLLKKSRLMLSAHLYENVPLSLFMQPEHACSSFL